MTTLTRLVAAILISWTVFGCAGKKVRLDPVDPLFRQKNEFYGRYRFWIFEDELMLLASLSTSESVDKFQSDFWKIRDTDPRTEKNELKELIDSRISDVENEIFAADTDIPQTIFSRNGGLGGELAHVYLLYGAPLRGHKFKLSEGIHHTELMVWYYFDFRGRPLMRFLFYESYGQMHLFKNQMPIGTFEDLLNPSFSPLRKLSNRAAVHTVEEMAELWYELERNDPEWIFRTAIFEFSSYPDVVIEGGGNKRFGALDVPKPAALVAAALKPTVSGQPADLVGREFIYSRDDSIIPAEFKIIRDTNSKPSFVLSVAYKDLDWEVKGKAAEGEPRQGREVESILILRISFQNKTTRALTEFETGITLKGPRQAVESLTRLKDPNTGKAYGKEINLDSMLNQTGPDADKVALRQIIDQKVGSGEFVVNAHLEHAVTKKYNSWREEMVIN